MRYRFLFLILISFIGFNFTSYAQNALILKRLYRLDNGSATEDIGRYDGTIYGTVTPVQDRYGNTEGALKFFDHAYISIPSLVSDFDYKTTGYTVSFWTYIDEYHYKNHGKTPWKDSDPIVRAFYAINDTDDVVLTGFHRRADRMVIDRYTNDTNNHLKNWGVWLWDPINFTQRIGWYHIVISYEPNRTFVWVFYPNGQTESSAYYFGIQDYSVATHWSIGNSSGKSLILDAFSVYQGAASESDARDLHAQEMLPDGMYKISLCANEETYMHTVNNSVEGSTPIEIFSPVDNRHTFKWIISPVSGKTNVYTIRLAYENMYLHCSGHSSEQSTRIELLEYQPSHPLAYEWFFQSSGDGYYHISSNADRSKYLHPVSRSTKSGTRLAILTYAKSFPKVYKWKLHLLKTKYELNQNQVAIDSPYEVVLSDNTFLGLMPDTPIQGDVTALHPNRGSYPSLLDYWWFLPGKDGSYKIYNVSHPSYDLHPKSRQVSAGVEIQALKYAAAYDKFYSFVLEKPNKYGRRYQFKHALNTDLIVTATTSAIGSKLSLQKDGNDKANQWALFKSRKPGANKEIYDLKPGIYRIVSMADNKKAVTTRNNTWISNSDILIGEISSPKYTSYYWVVDYERDSNGNPVLDGTYTIQLFATDKLYWHTKSHAISNSARLELYALDRDNLGSEKWYIKPTRTGDGAFFIQCAGNPNLYVHLANHATLSNTQLELWPYDATHADTFKWKFEQVSITAPFAEGTYRVASAKDKTKYLHVKNNSTSKQALELRSYNPENKTSFEWYFMKNEDNTYSIQNFNSMLYVHPIGQSTINGTRLEQIEYDASYSPYYKWIITAGTGYGAYKIISVADPTKYIHLSGHLALEGNEVEILLINKGYENTYEWIFQNIFY